MPFGYCRDLESSISRADSSVDAIVARLMKEQRGKTVAVLAPLVTHRKGFYTDLAKWALSKGYWHLRVDGKLLPTRPFPRIDRFKEHTIELPVADLVVSAKAETQLRQLLAKSLERAD